MARFRDQRAAKQRARELREAESAARASAPQRRGPSIIITTPFHKPEVHLGYLQSLLATIQGLAMRGMPCAHGVNISSWLPSSRDILVSMAIEEASVEWCMCIDSDQTWKPSDIFELIDAAKYFDLRAVCGVYVYRTSKKPVAVFATDVEPKGIMRAVHTCGGGFLLLHRTLIEDLSERAPKYLLHCDDPPDAPGQRIIPSIWSPNPPGYYGAMDAESLTRSTDAFAQVEGEDSAFCRKVRELGEHVWCHPRVHVGHMSDSVPLYPDYSLEEGKGLHVGQFPVTRDAARVVAPHSQSGGHDVVGEAPTGAGVSE